MAKTVLRLEIRGHVHGVGNRASMVERACQLDVCGWVRNRRDGSVEAMVAGTAQAVEQIVTWARRGPRAARPRCEAQVHVLAFVGVGRSLAAQGRVCAARTVRKLPL
ncbi:MAG: acylphosphatase, partial [Rubrivivax sp.]